MEDLTSGPGAMAGASGPCDIYAGALDILGGGCNLCRQGRVESRGGCHIRRRSVEHEERRDNYCCLHGCLYNLFELFQSSVDNEMCHNKRAIYSNFGEDDSEACKPCV